MKNTKLTKVQILTRNLNIRGDLGQTFLALLAFTLREHQNHSGTCGTYGCPHRRGFRGSKNLHLKPELRMVFEFSFENYCTNPTPTPPCILDETEPRRG